MFRANFFIAPACLLVCLFHSLNAATIYVDASPAGAGDDGTSWDAAYSDLQSALSAASSGDAIWVAAGTYKPTSGTDRTATFQLKTGVALYGGFSGIETTLEDRDLSSNPSILSGDIGTEGDNTDNSYHVLTGSGTDATAILDGFTITAGNANSTTDPNDDGGGLYNDGGSPTLTNCTLSGNSADSYGGAIYNRSSSSPTLINCTLSGNSADNGGAIFNLASSPALTNCTLSGNSADSYGGAISNFSSSSPMLTNSTLSGNSAFYGGAISNYDNSSPTLTNSTLSGNSAKNGGAISNEDSSPTLINCTLSGNSASSNGGAIYNYNSSSPTLTNCIVWSNSAAGATATASASIENTGSSSATYAYCLIANSGGSGSWNSALGTDNGNNLDANPRFVTPIDPANAPSSSGNLRLQFGSPAVGAGDVTVISALTDLDSQARVVNTIDLGAYESIFPDTTEYLNWAANYGLNYGSDSDTTDNPDNDSRTNLEEFAFGTDPTDPNDAVTRVSDIVEVTDSDTKDYYTITIVVREDAVFTGSPSPSATIDGITYAIGGSTDLSAFNVPVQSLTPARNDRLTAPSGWALASFRFDSDMVSQNKGFIRVTVSEEE